MRPHLLNALINNRILKRLIRYLLDLLAELQCLAFLIFIKWAAALAHVESLCLYVILALALRKSPLACWHLLTAAFRETLAARLRRLGVADKLRIAPFIRWSPARECSLF